MNKKETMIKLPDEVMAFSGFSASQRLTAHSTKGAVIVLKGEMTAMELVNAIDGLSELAARLTVALARTCGFCDYCGNEDVAMGAKGAERVKDCALCRSFLEPKDRIHIPSDILSDAGIPKDAKLDAYADFESGTIIIEKACSQNSISDVPAYILEMLAESGVCLAELEDLILTEEIAYEG